MSERSFSTDGIERRGFLSAVAVGLGGAGLSHHALARESNDATYVIEQGGRCVPITPLSGDETVEEFYDYRTPNTDPSGPAYSSYGTTDLQRPETSICFLYDGPNGLSLVVVHDKLNDGTNGGAVTFRFGNLTTGEWVVGDDIYDGESNYDRFQETENGWKIDWTWTEGRSDGGAYRPLGDEFAVTIDPAFNEEAALYGDPYEGEISDWQVLSGDRSNPERVSLSLTDPVTIRAGSCGGSGTTTTTVEETTEETTEEDQAEGSVSLDVEVVPGRVNPKSHGRLPVVVHSSAEFDATTIEPGSVELHPGGAAPGKRVRTDANGDGRTDLKLLFWMDAVGIDGDTDSVKLTGRTRDGRKVAGTADVRLVPHGDDDGGDEKEDEADDHGKDEKDGKGGTDEKGNKGGKGDKHEKGGKHGGDDEDDEWEKKEEELEEKREKAEEKWEEKEEELEEKWEKKKEKWEKKKEKREKKKEKREDEREDDDE